MKPLLRLYLAVGIAAQFMVAGVIYFGCLLFTQCYREMDVKLPSATLFVISSGHWAFLWPVAWLLLTTILLYRARTEGVLLHLFCGMMLAAVAILFIVFLDFTLPFMNTLSFAN